MQFNKYTHTQTHRQTDTHTHTDTDTDTYIDTDTHIHTSVATDPDNLENGKEAEGGGQGTPRA